MLKWSIWIFEFSQIFRTEIAGKNAEAHGAGTAARMYGAKRKGKKKGN